MSEELVLGDWIVIVVGVAVGAFCIWLAVVTVNRPERIRAWMNYLMQRSVRIPLSVIVAAGLAAICTVCLLIWDELRRFDLRFYSQLITLTALPTIFFMGAFLMSWRAPRIQRVIGWTAGFFGIVAVGVAMAEISWESLFDMPNWYPLVCGFIGWAFGMVASVVILLMAATISLWNRTRRG